MTRNQPTGPNTHNPMNQRHRRLPIVRLAVVVAALWLAVAPPAPAVEPAATPLPPGANPHSLPSIPDGSSVLFDNGPIITCYGCGWGGANESWVQSALGLFDVAWSFRQSDGQSLADDFTIPPPFSWTIDAIVFDSCSNDVSTVEGYYIRIWDGPPDAGGSVVWGDLTTNRLLDSYLINAYRVPDFQPGQPIYPIRENVATVGVTLGPGHYWVEWAANSSFPWGPGTPPITILGQTTTGDALAYDAGVWSPVIDDGTAAAPQGMPFIIIGSVTGSSGSLYVLNDTADTLSRVDLLSGSSHLVGPTGVHVSAAGMALDTSTGTAYVSDVDMPGGYYGLGWIDLSTGAITRIGSHVTSANVWGLAYDSLHDVLYGADLNCPGGPGLSVVDRGTGAASCLGPFGNGRTAYGLAYDPANDTLYALDPSLLLAVNRSTGAATAVGPHGITTLSGDAALDFAPDLGVLIAATDNGDLWALDPATGAGTLLQAAVVPTPSGTAYVPEGTRLAAFGPFAGRLWDNGDTDLAQALSNGVPPGLFTRRTVLDDLVVPAGQTWTMRHLRWRHVWDTRAVPAGRGAEISVRANDPNGGGPGVDGPGAVIATATVRFYAEFGSGREAFGRAEAVSMAEFDPIVLGAGRYWLEWAAVGPDNSFALADAGAIRDNQCWVDYPDAGGLQPSESFFGTPYDLTWAVGEAALGVFADGFESGNPTAWSSVLP